MTTRIPDLASTRLHQVSVCVYFDSDDAKACDLANKLGLIELEGLAPSGPQNEWLTLAVEPAADDIDGEPHLHVNIARDDWFPELPDPRGDIGQFSAIVNQFRGCPGRLYVQGQFEVPLDEVPEEGLVKGLAQVSTEIGGLKLSMAGAELAIQGGQFRRIRWTVSGKELLRGELRSATSNILISDSYVEDAVRFLNDGVNKIILAQDTRDEK